MVVDVEVAVVCRGTEAERSAAILLNHLPSNWPGIEYRYVLQVVHRAARPDK